VHEVKRSQPQAAEKEKGNLPPAEFHFRLLKRLWWLRLGESIEMVDLEKSITYLNQKLSVVDIWELHYQNQQLVRPREIHTK
jgi:hypothetical protein